MVALHDLGEVTALADVFSTVWQSLPGRTPVPVEVMLAVAHSGGYLAGLEQGGRLVGGSVGLVGLTEGPEVRPTLHSHVTGVLPGSRGRGLLLKQHQREWCLARGITQVTWTFDPLVRRNAHFNLTKLGATSRDYLVDFYGPMTDGLNAGEPSDRLYTRWDLQDPPRHGPVVATVALPEDVESLRRTDPGEARRWRLQVRDQLTAHLASGLVVTGVDDQGRLELRAPA